ncbi:MAG TPA: carbohydrate ABC transporter permease [Candidatus Limnocylindria bacterium]|jgi:arabinogalactan oligomer/maltooligosaccharide transport system permease protein
MSGATSVPVVPAAQAGPAAAAAVAKGGGGRTDSFGKRVVIHAVLILASLIAAFPVFRVLSVSLRPEDRLLEREFKLFPEGATLDSFVHVLTDTDFPQWLFNSLIITVGTSIVGLLFAATSAYAFSRYKFPGRGVGLTALLATQLIPATMLLVPLFILSIQLDLKDSYRGLVIAYSVTSVPFSIWILKGYYDTVPIELEEAARIDGASQLEAFWRILLPLSTPALAIVFLFNFLAAWNEFVLARVLIGSSTELFTWPLGVLRFQAQFQTQWGDLAAASILISIPVVALFLYSSKWLISGVTLGGVKG